MPHQHDRLDSWKAIVDYLDRDVRTLRRWEQEGLPIRRVRGGRGHSVFAYRSEIDAWLKRAAETSAAVDSPTRLEEPSADVGAFVPPASVTAASRWHLRPRQWGSLAVIAAVVVGVVAWRAMAPSAAGPELSVSATTAGMVATDSAGHERWRYEFPKEEVVTLPRWRPPASVVTTGEWPGVFLVSAFTVRRADAAPVGGALRWFSPEGRLTRTFSFDDRWTFAGQRSFSEPWVITDLSVSDVGGQRRFALAANHYLWWPSVVTMFDANWQRRGTFVNSGWVEALQWLSPERLAIAGFNQAHDGGMVALLDAASIDGSSPEDPASEFRCETCPPGLPLSYFVFPRSELNRVTGSGFNRATVTMVGDRVLVHTDETDSWLKGVPSTDADYEFSTSLELQRASYSDRYWDRHRVLEREGKLTHSREHCPEKDGPPVVLRWDPAAGWRTIKTSAPTL